MCGRDASSGDDLVERSGDDLNFGKLRQRVMIIILFEAGRAAKSRRRSTGPRKTGKSFFPISFGV